MKKKILSEIDMRKCIMRLSIDSSRTHGRNCGTESQVLDVQAQCESVADGGHWKKVDKNHNERLPMAPRYHLQILFYK